MLRRYWGGGSFCADNFKGLPAKMLSSVCMVPNPMDATAPFIEAECYAKQFVPLCNTNGDVMLPFGSPQYIGLGLIVFATLVLVELFGSPAMKNTQVRKSFSRLLFRSTLHILTVQ